MTRKELEKLNKEGKLHNSLALVKWLKKDYEPPEAPTFTAMLNIKESIDLTMIICMDLNTGRDRLLIYPREIVRILPSQIGKLIT